MTIREITDLRKSGRLQEALEAAETEFAKNANNYTAGALFWCLRELSMNQDATEAEATLERMKSLYDEFCHGEQIMERALATLLRRATPHYQEIKDAQEKAKRGENVSAEYQAIADIFKAGNLDASLYDEFGWLTYYVLKNTPLNDAHARKTLLFNYLKLNLSRPSKLHSSILSEAIKVEENTPLQFRIRDFMRLWGMDNLQTGDWEGFVTDDGRTCSSTVEKLIKVYTKELKTDGVASPEEFIKLVDEALIKYPNNQYMPYYKANVLISQGRIDEALDYYKDLIRRTPSKYYLWFQSAELVDDIETKIGLLCKALNCGAEDEFLGSIRLNLASILISKGLMSNARFEVDKYNQTYQNNGWNIKPEYWPIYQQVITEQPSENNDALYNEFSVKADEFIYGSLPTILVVKVSEAQVEDRNHPGRRILTWTLRTENSTIRLRKPTKFGLNRRTPNGKAFDIKMQDNRIVWIEEHTGTINEPWIEEREGEVRTRSDRNGKNFAIISGTYVAENLLNNVVDGQHVKILAVRQDDGRWRAVSLAES